MMQIIRAAALENWETDLRCIENCCRAADHFRNNEKQRMRLKGMNDMFMDAVYEGHDLQRSDWEAQICQLISESQWQGLRVISDVNVDYIATFLNTPLSVDTRHSARPLRL